MPVGGKAMKYMIRLYRILKPVCIYTSYLFTSLTVLCLAVNELTGRRMTFGSGFIWGLFVFSLGSIGLQRVFLEREFPAHFFYPVRLALYAFGIALWGYCCLNAASAFYGSGQMGREALAPALAAGVACGLGLELFNRYRAHMYNTLLEQYKRRKRI